MLQKFDLIIVPTHLFEARNNLTEANRIKST